MESGDMKRTRVNPRFALPPPPALAGAVIAADAFSQAKALSDARIKVTASKLKPEALAVDTGVSCPGLDSVATTRFSEADSPADSELRPYRPPTPTYPIIDSLQHLTSNAEDGPLPGWRVHPCQGDEHVQSLPARTGTGLPLRKSQLRTFSAVPPPYSEPVLQQKSDVPGAMAAKDLARTACPEEVINEIVYDCMVPPPRLTVAPEGTEGPGTLHPDQWIDEDWWSVSSDADCTLVFESRFESGNLRRAIKVFEHSYDLVLRPDVNTRGHTQWYYFSVSNVRKDVPYKFNIINLQKEDSLYSSGMQPLIHSARDAATQGLGWRRSGSQIAYFANQIKQKKSGKPYYTLTFTLTFPHDFDTVHVCHCYPYTYTDLQRYLVDLDQDPIRNRRVRRRPLCLTLAGNTCDLLTVTNFQSTAQDIAKRKGVVLSARVHPGETGASWMMKGAIDFLLGDSLDACILRDNFVFKVIPMLNPDGVICGNYRCNLACVDLNRCWADPSRKLHPTVMHQKQMMKRFAEEREIVLFVDLHGHSRRRDMFCYGCERRNPRDVSGVAMGGAPPACYGQLAEVPAKWQERVFPRLLHHNADGLFNFRYSTFKVQRSKESTARVVCWRELGLCMSYTLEASFCGPSRGPEAGMHYQTVHYERMGARMVQSILDLRNPDGVAVQRIVAELESLERRRLAGQPLQNGMEGEADDGCTDSDESDGEGPSSTRAAPLAAAANEMYSGAAAARDELQSTTISDNVDSTHTEATMEASAT